MNILALNAGSSSLKYRLFRVTADFEEEIVHGTAERANGTAIEEATQTAIGSCLSLGIDAVGHRVVHGGPKFSQATLVTDDVLVVLRSLSHLDPLHNVTEIALIEEARRLLPGLPSVAVFDTSFHQTMPPVAYTYALPADLTKRLGLRRYGFHGISHRYVSQALLTCIRRPPEGSRIITCHLGSGASVCAILDGKSIDTSMGLTPLEGLVMGTRSGDIDAGLLLYLLRNHGITPDALNDILNNRSGLIGISGISSDMREIESAAATGDAGANLAMDVFCYRVCKYIGAYTAVLGGIDAIAFTGGIGEGSAVIRRRICEKLTFLGVILENRGNDTGGKNPTRLSKSDSPVAIWVVPTDEERQIARETRSLLAGVGLAS